jgi:hypothetical protein
MIDDSLVYSCFLLSMMQAVAQLIIIENRRTNHEFYKEQSDRIVGLLSVCAVSPMPLQLSRRNTYSSPYPVSSITPYPQLSILQQDVSSTLTTGSHTINNSIKLNLVRNSKNSDNCIIYLHGLSSYCL